MASDRERMTEAWRAEEEAAEAGGGRHRLERQRKLGRLTARDRLARLFDGGEYDELGRHVTHRGRGAERARGDGVVTAVGRVDGRGVAAFAHDVTVRRGALGEDGAGKVVRLYRHALAHGFPVVGLHDSDGARVDEGPGAIRGYGEIIRASVEASGVVPQVAVVCGLCVGAAAYTAALADSVVMVEPWGFMFITGSKVTRTITGEDTPMEDLGGAVMHATVSGAANLVVPDDAAAVDAARRLLSYLPSRFDGSAPVRDTGDPPGRATPELWDLLPVSRRKAYDVLPVVQAVVDRDSLLEWSPRYARNLVTALARLDGHAVGVVASQPRHRAGALDVEAARKGARFVQLCGAFNLPIVTLADVPGFVPGRSQEQGGILLHGAKLLSAYGAAGVPRVSVVLGKSYGGASVLAYTGDVVLALPHARYDVVGADAAAAILAHGAELTEEELAARKQTFIRERDRAHAAAEAGLVDRVVLPEELRAALCRTLSLLRGGVTALPPRRRLNPPT
ncbi:MAG: methylmalonyl-CoA carboxyltransferase [Deltaproteobacteria bacterium]|nr:methylmalonyl-CoA carboxyltransferase [Deltaproteobacteria bacterium]